MDEDYAAEPKFKGIINDFQHFLNIRGDNHKFMEHLFMERLKVKYGEIINRYLVISRIGTHARLLQFSNFVSI